MLVTTTIAISSAHGRLVRGARGPAPWGLDEVNESRRIVNRVVELLRSAGVSVSHFHDETSTTVTANLNAITAWHNSRQRTVDVSVHLNAFEPTDSPRGTEVLHKSQATLAANVSRAMANAGRFINRGSKLRNDLSFLNRTQRAAILLEVCFVDSRADVNLFNQHFQAICRAIAESISGARIPGEPVQPPTTTPPPQTQRPTLRQGARGDDVRVLQQLLNTFPTTLPRLVADGNFGAVTDNRVREFQRNNALVVDGIVGPRSWSALEPTVTSRNIVDLVIEPKGHEQVIINGVKINETTHHEHVEITATHTGDTILNINGEDFQVEPP